MIVVKSKYVYKMIHTIMALIKDLELVAIIIVFVRTQRTFYGSPFSIGAICNLSHLMAHIN